MAYVNKDELKQSLQAIRDRLAIKDKTEAEALVASVSYPDCVYYTSDTHNLVKNGNVVSSGIGFGIVDPSSTATLYTATVPGITELKDGTAILLKNGKVTSSSGFKININSLGAKPVYSNMSAATEETTIFNINYTMLFIYDSTRVSGGAWICYRGYYQNTNTIGYQLRGNNSTMIASDTARYYKIYFTSADGKKFVPASVDSTNNATSARPVNQRPIDPFGSIIYMSANTNFAAGATLSAASCWQQYNITLGYSFNRTGKALTLTNHAPVYVKCAPLTNGSAIMDADTPIVLSLPTTEDGKIYIFLGIASAATTMELRLEHPVYYYSDGAIRLWTNAKTFDESSIPTVTSDLINDSGFIQDYSKIPLTIQAKTAGTITFGGSSGKTIQYKRPGGKWTTMTTTTKQLSFGNFNPGEVLMVKGNEIGYGSCKFNGTAQTEVYGNIMSLINGDNFITNSEFPNTTSSDLSGLFSGYTNLVDASNLILPADYVPMSGYASMFKDCTSLVNAPELPATQFYAMSGGSYSYMFCGCTSLTKAPSVLPALTIGLTTYAYMFKNCTSLEKAPFIKCTNGSSSYACYEMFKDCTSLNFIHLSFMESAATLDWLSNVAETGTAIIPVGSTFADKRSASRIPEGWTVEEESDSENLLVTFTHTTGHYYRADKTVALILNAHNNKKLVIGLLVDVDESEGTFNKFFYLYNNFNDEEGDSPMFVTIDYIDGSFYMQYLSYIISSDRWSLEPSSKYTLIASIYSPTFTGTPEAPTPAAGNNTTRIATTAFVLTAIGNKVDKVTGKLLSTEDYTSAEKTKLAGIAAGAEVNVQSDWEESDSTSDAYIANKPFETVNSTQFVVDSTTKELSINKDILPVDYSKQYFTIESLSDNNLIQFKNAQDPGGYNPNVGPWDEFTNRDIYYSVDDGLTWNVVEIRNWNTVYNITTLDANEKVLLKSTSTYYSYASGESGSNFIISGQCIIYGNIMSLLYGDGFIGQTSFNTRTSNGYDVPLGKLFYNNTNLISAENLILPATTLAPSCYGQMFYGCTSLTKVPELPVTTLAQGCYRYMFYNCTSLIKAPELPATTLATYCYQYMFYNCTSLVNAPKLLATTLTESCYDTMFTGCTALTKAPELPATTLTNYCYSSMFAGCTSLTTAPELPATTLANNCYFGMFRNCTSLTKAPELPATTLVNNCYNYMFSGCTSLNYIKAMFISDNGNIEDYTDGWVARVAASGTFVKNSAATWNETGSDGVPTSWNAYTESQYKEVKHYELATVATSGLYSDLIGAPLVKLRIHLVDGHDITDPNIIAQWQLMIADINAHFYNDFYTVNIWNYFDWDALDTMSRIVYIPNFYIEEYGDSYGIRKSDSDYKIGDYIWWYNSTTGVIESVYND